MILSVNAFEFLFPVSLQSSWTLFVSFQASQRIEQQQHEKIPGREKKGNYNINKVSGHYFWMFIFTSVLRIQL